MSSLLENLAVCREWSALPFWTNPLEQLTPEAIALVCDADRRTAEAADTMIIRLRG